MQVTHPLAERDGSLPEAVAVAPGESYAVDDDGSVDLPDEHAERLRSLWANHYGGDEPPDEAAPVDPAEYTVDELREEIQTVDSVDAVEALLTAERDEKNRETAVEAIEGRLAELQTDDQEE